MSKRQYQETIEAEQEIRQALERLIEVYGVSKIQEKITQIQKELLDE